MRTSIKLVLTTSALIFTNSLLFAEGAALPAPSLSEMQEARNAEEVENLENSIESKHGIVIGSDSRVRYTSNQMPWKALGKVRFGSDNAGWICSATLVGPRHILTNAHCIDLLYPVFFYPSYNNGDYLDKTPVETYGVWVYWGTPTADTSTGTHVMGSGYTQQNDWAIVVLNQSVGNQFGWLNTQKWNNTWLGQSIWTNAGYPDAGTRNDYSEYPLRHVGCAVRANQSNYLVHDCDTGPGSSGSPIFGSLSGQYTITGLNNWHWGSGSSCTPYKAGVCANGAVTVDRFYSTLQLARSTYP